MNEFFGRVIRWGVHFEIRYKIDGRSDVHQIWCPRQVDGAESGGGCFVRIFEAEGLETACVSPDERQSALRYFHV